MMMTDPVPLARRSGVAAWRQIAERIEADIRGGVFAAGARLPTEAQFAARFGVNRHTVRAAMKVLASQGLVRVAQGSGAFVENHPLAYPIGARTRFSDIVVAQAREPAGKLLRAAETAADAEAAVALGVEAGARALRLESAHFADGVPISWAVVWFPLPRFARMGEAYGATGSITAALAACGVADYRRAITRIGAAAADPLDAARLEIATGRPVLILESVNVDLDGRPMQWTRSRFSADRVKVVVEA